MKKYILSGIAILAIVAVAVVNVSFSLQSNYLSSVSLANIEALAQETTNCPGRSCSYANTLGTCTVCCPNGKTPKCNSWGCECQGN